MTPQRRDAESSHRSALLARRAAPRSRRAIRAWLVGGILALSAPLVGCGGGGGSASATGGIEGTVRDMVSQRAVAHAVVSAAGLTTETDAQGHFQLVGLPAGPQTLTVQAAGYATYNDTVNITTGITTLPDILLVESPPPPPP